MGKALGKILQHHGPPRNGLTLTHKSKVQGTSWAFYPLIPLPLLPEAGEKGRKTGYLSILDGKAAQNRENQPIPRPWGRGKLLCVTGLTYFHPKRCG